MPRYIDADAIEPSEIVIPLIDGGYEYVEVVYMDDLRDIPTADVVKRKHGEWIWMGEKGDSRFMCSVCKSKENVPTIMGKPEVWWYCPNCGADMRKETEDE